MPARVNNASSSLNTPIDCRDKEGHTALLWAAYQGHTTTVRFLLQEGANLHAVDSDGCSALHWASNRNHVEVVQFLIDEGANIRLADSQGETPGSLMTRVESKTVL